MTPVLDLPRIRDAYLERNLLLQEAALTRLVMKSQNHLLSHIESRFKTKLVRIWKSEEDKFLALVHAHPHLTPEQPKLLESRYPQLDALTKLYDGVIDEATMRKAFGDEYHDIFTAGWNGVFDSFALQFGSKIPNRLPISWIQNHTARLTEKWGAQVTATQRERIYTALEGCYERQATYNEMLATIRSVYVQAPENAQVVVRTESRKAYGGSEFAANKALGLGLKSWILSGSPYCYIDVCADNAALGDIGIDETFYDMDGEEIDAAPAHPNCMCSVGYAMDESWTEPEGMVEPSMEAGEAGDEGLSPSAVPEESQSPVVEPLGVPTASEREALDGWGGTQGALWNSNLRAGREVSSLTEVRQTRIGDLDAVISRNSLDTDKLLFRGIDDVGFKSMGFDPEDYPQMRSMVGSIFQDRGFVATTTDATITQYFGSNVVEIQAIAGQEAIEFGVKSGITIGRSEIENEVLLPRGLKFQVVNVIEKVSDQGAHTGWKLIIRILKS